MALTLLRLPRASLLLLLLMRFWSVMSARALDVVYSHPPEVICGKGLTDCCMSQAFPFAAALPDLDDTVNVTHVQLEVILCCSTKQDCEPCLKVVITLHEVDHAEQVSEESGERIDEEDLGMSQIVEEGGYCVLPEPRALVKVGLSSPFFGEIWKTLQFKSSYSDVEQAPQQHTHELVLIEEVTLGSPVVVTVEGNSNGTLNIQNVTVPSLQEVCFMNLEGTVKECDAPRLRAVMDHKRNVVLRIENTDARQDEIMCMMLRNKMPGEVLAWPKGETEMVISSNFVAPCLCFQVWWKTKDLRREFCPFENQPDALEQMQHSVSVSVEEYQKREGGKGLSWNVTAPCRLDAEVWLCKKDFAGGQCEEVTGSKQILNNRESADWHATRNGHWKTGEFNESSHPLLCVQLKIHGLDTYLEPHCPFTKSRWRWSLLLLIGLLLMCLTIIGAFLIQGVLKGYMWRWLKEDDVKGAVGGGHVVLLYPPDDSQALPELMSHLGSSLQALGFSVSLDLWSQVELSVLGPVPWLHSRLNRLQTQGGKVVLVLTQAAWIGAEEWGARSLERYTPRERGRYMEEGDAGRNYTASSHSVDVFTASFSCILADYLQGRAGERFMLVQFESLPPEPPGGYRPLPELFRGLHVYSLPSQSLGFLTELAGARQVATASARRKKAGGLRMASRALARGLSGFRAGTTVLRLAGVSQSCVGVEESGETVPLQLSLATPPSSPDTSPEVSDMEWV